MTVLTFTVSEDPNQGAITICTFGAKQNNDLRQLAIH